MITLAEATPDMLAALRDALPADDRARDHLVDATAASLSVKVLCESGKPVAVLGVSKARQAWMHTVPTFHKPMDAFRVMRRQFREWADEHGEVWCAMKESMGRPVRVMGLIGQLTVRDGVAGFVLKGRSHVL